MKFIDYIVDGIFSFIESFNRLRETIILKDTSSLEKQIEDLKKIRGKLARKGGIDKDIRLLELGLEGEKEIDFELKNSNIGMYVLHDINILVDDVKAQVDYVIVTRAFTYLVECKNLVGNITIDSNGNFKRECEINGVKVTEGIYSPYTQAQRHVDILKKRWLARNNKFLTTIHDKDFDKLWYKPVVVLANSKGILNSKYAPKEIRKNTIRNDQLVRYIQDDIDNYDKELFSSKKVMKQIADNFLEQHVEMESSIVMKYKQKLKDEKNLICPLCHNKLVIRNSYYGKFYGCSNYPECRYTKNIEK